MDTSHLAAGTLLDPAGLAAKATTRLGVATEQVFDGPRRRHPHPRR